MSWNQPYKYFMNNICPFSFIGIPSLTSPKKIIYQFTIIILINKKSSFAPRKGFINSPPSWNDRCRTWSWHPKLLFHWYGRHIMINISVSRILNRLIMSKLKWGKIHQNPGTLKRTIPQIFLSETGLLSQSRAFAIALLNLTMENVKPRALMLKQICM